MFWLKLQKFLFWFFLASIITSIVTYYAIGDDFGLENLRLYIKSFGIWAPLIFTIIYTFLSIFIPTTPLMIIAGLLFGFWWGLIYTIIGSFASAMIVFYICQKLGREKVKFLLKSKYLKKLDDYNKKLGNNGIFDLIVLRLVPIIPFNILNVLMGVSNITTKDYVIGTIVGFLPSHIVTVYLANWAIKLF